MKMSELLLPEFDQEAAATRRSLERIPDEMFSWKPHEKSYTMGYLGTHLAMLPGWTVATLKHDSLDLAPPGGGAQQQPKPATKAELLAIFDKNIAEARSAIISTDDTTMMKPWSLLRGGNTVFTLPRAAVLRSYVMNHIVHHRAQLGVYFRLNNIPVPSTYGPSADEQGM